MVRAKGVHHDEDDVRGGGGKLAGPRDFPQRGLPDKIIVIQADVGERNQSPNHLCREDSRQPRSGGLNAPAGLSGQEADPSDEQ